MNRWLTPMLCLLCLTAAAGAANFPRQITYQGRVTDNADMPISDPAANVEFRLFDAAAGGTQVWNEVTTVAVADGLFSHDLGSSCGLCEIPTSVMFDDDTLWLEVVFEGEVITPRTMLTASPVAYRVASVDKSTGGTITGEVVVDGNSGGNQFAVNNSGFGRGGFFAISNAGNTEPAVQGTHVGAGPGGSFFSDGGGPGITASATGGVAAELFGSVRTYGNGYYISGVDTIIEARGSSNILNNRGSDGNGENWRLWGASFGQLLLYDNAPANNQLVNLAAFSSGGSLLLTDGGGNNVVLDASVVGDNAAQLPVNAINAAEMLNEPGVANNKTGTTVLGGGALTVTSRSITCPTAGYVIATVTGTLDLSHVNGGISQSSVWITDDELVSLNKPRTAFTVSGNAPSGNYATPYAVTGVFAVPSGTTTFYLRANENAGGVVSAQDNQLTLLFVPTAYGFVVSNTPAAMTDDPALEPLTGSNEPAATAALADQRLERELASMQAQLDALKAKFATETAMQTDAASQR